MIALIIDLRQDLISIHLCYTLNFYKHYMNVVKVHGVFPSSRWYSVSSRRFQIH